MKPGSSKMERGVNNSALLPLIPQVISTRTVGRRRGAGARTVFTYPCPERAIPDRVEHDPERRALRLTRPDGTAIAFRDQPVRFLVVEPDPQSGKLRPAISMGKAKVVYLCPEVVE
jgi:hypothetical protein